MRKIIFLFLSILVFLIIPASVLSCAPTERWITERDDYDYFQYRCTADCGGEFQRQECRENRWRQNVRTYSYVTIGQYPDEVTICRGTTSTTDHSITYCGIPGTRSLDRIHTVSGFTGSTRIYDFTFGWYTTEIGQPWQKCVGCPGTTICRTPHRFKGSYFNQCDGDCIGRPASFGIFTNPVDLDTHSYQFLGEEYRRHIERYQQTDLTNIILPLFADWSIETTVATIYAVAELLGIEPTLGNIDEIHNYIINNIVDKYHFRVLDGENNRIFPPPPGWWDRLWGRDALYVVIDSKYYSSFKQPGSCFFEILKYYNAQVKVFCHAGSGWDTTNASGRRDSGWDDNIFKTSTAPETRSIFGGQDAIDISNYIRDNDRLPILGGKGWGPWRTDCLFQEMNIDIDWEGPGATLKDIHNDLLRETIMPPVVIKWCPLNSDEKRRLRAKTEALVREKLGKRVYVRGEDGVEGYYRNRIFPAGFLTGYQLEFYEYRRLYEYGYGHKEEREWVMHFRHKHPFEKYRPWAYLKPDIEMPKDLEALKRMPPPYEIKKKSLARFVLDQNKFYLTYGTKYKFRIRRCAFLVEKAGEKHDGHGQECFDFGQKWHFETGGGAANLPKIEKVITPISRGIGAQGLPFSIEVENISGANFYAYSIRVFYFQENRFTTKRGFIKDDRIHLLDLFRPYPIETFVGDTIFTYLPGRGDIFLRLNQRYRLDIRGCLSDDVNINNIPIDCVDEYYAFSVHFITPGARPINLRLAPVAPEEIGIDGEVIPVGFKWGYMTGVRSFRIDLYEYGGVSPINSFVTRFNNITIGYPGLLLRQNYKIKVWSCADLHGQVCVDEYGGDLANRHLEYADLVFTTFMLEKPTGLEVYPEGDEAYPPFIDIAEGHVKTENFIYFDWKPVVGAAYYQIKIKHAGEVVITDIIRTNNFRIHQIDLIVAKGEGYHTWKVRACIDRDCRAYPITTGPWAKESFYFIPTIEIVGFGLVVCGMPFDNPYTPWDEREACTIRHIPLAAYVIIDFILWKIVPLILVLLIMLTAFFYYIAFADVEAIDQITPKVKKMWKNFAIGFFIMFFGFMIINIFLGIIDFNVDLFGRWYEL